MRLYLQIHAVQGFHAGKGFMHVGHGQQHGMVLFRQYGQAHRRPIRIGIADRLCQPQGGETGRVTAEQNHGELQAAVECGGGAVGFVHHQRQYYWQQ